jgi:hypothetical protein
VKAPCTLAAQTAFIAVFTPRFHHFRVNPRRL